MMIPVNDPANPGELSALFQVEYDIHRRNWHQTRQKAHYDMKRIYRDAFHSLYCAYETAVTIDLYTSTAVYKRKDDTPPGGGIKERLTVS